MTYPMPTPLPGVPMPPPMPPIQPEMVRTNHVLHLLLSIFTLAWFLVWPLVHLSNESANRNAMRWYRQELANYQRNLWIYQQNAGYLPPNTPPGYRAITG